MKKNLKISGKVQITRAEMVKILCEVLEHTEELILERAIMVDENGNPVNIDSVICYVHQIKSDEIPDRFDAPKTVVMKKGFSRPNYGINRAIKDLFAVDRVYSFDEVYKELHKDFPHLTRQQLKQYLNRPRISGTLEIDGDQYWNPNEKK